ncbi:MAG: hypothetical protein H6736_20595 [Alphaproteobacteria bacterium]|nr:hypothetical protein [Alphaproteobacteria bacterium]MCB9694217.1 hypothetical protein [Alphaproteobacteria bacterium]
MVLLAAASLLGCGKSPDPDGIESIAFGGERGGLFEEVTAVACSLRPGDFTRVEWTLGEEEDARSLTTELPIGPEDHVRRAAMGFTRLSDPPLTEMPTRIVVSYGPPVPNDEDVRFARWVPMWLHGLALAEPGYEASRLTDATVFCEDFR